MTVCHNYKKSVELVGQYHLLANEYIVRIFKHFFIFRFYFILFLAQMQKRVRF